MNVLLRGLKSLDKQNGIFDRLPLDVRTLVKTPRTVISENHPDGLYHHFGLREGITKRLIHRSTSHLPDQVDILINIDGIPISGSSPSQLWPILGMIKGDRQPFPIGIFHGHKKPSCSNTFLERFVTEARSLTNIELAEKEVSVKILCIICDAPAKSFILGIFGHTSKHGCPKCTTIGKYYVCPGKKHGRVVFLDLDAPARLHEDFFSEHHSHHHVTKTLLADLDIDLVEDIVLDYMHLVCIGVMRKLLTYWIKRDTTRDLIDRLAQTTISSRLLRTREYVPEDFVRLPRSLADLHFWKATELRQFLLYTGPVVLKGVIPESLYDHFMCLHTAIRLLSSENHCRKFNSYAEQLLRYFVKESGKLYGPQFVSHNVHCLIHLPADVMKFGHLDLFSSFPFENYLQYLKK